MFKIGDKVKITKEAALFLENPGLENLTGTIKDILFYEGICYCKCDGLIGESGLEVTDKELELLKG